MDLDTLISRIDLLCTKNGVNRTTALNDSGVGKNFIYNIQRGSTPSTDKIQQLAAYFNVSTDYLLGNDTTATKDPATKEEIMFALFNGADGITDEMYEEVKQFAAMVKMREEQKKAKK